MPLLLKVRHSAVQLKQCFDIASLFIELCVEMYHFKSFSPIDMLFK